MKIGDKLAFYRNEKKLTQQQVAEAIGVSRGALEHWEGNKREPKFEILAKLSILYGCEVVDFFSAGSRLDSDKKKVLIQKILNDLIYEGFLTQEMVDTMDELTKERLATSFDRHINSLSQK